MVVVCGGDVDRVMHGFRERLYDGHVEVGCLRGGLKGPTGLMGTKVADSAIFLFSSETNERVFAPRGVFHFNERINANSQVFTVLLLYRGFWYETTPLLCSRAVIV